MVFIEGMRVRVRKSEFVDPKYWDMEGTVLDSWTAPARDRGLCKIMFPGFGEVWIDPRDLQTVPRTELTAPIRSEQLAVVKGFLRVSRKIYADGESGSPLYLIPIGRIEVIKQPLGQENAEVFFTGAKGDREEIETVEAFAAVEAQLREAMK